MTTIGEQLKQTENSKTRERVARQSDMLRKFVKEDLLRSLKDNIEKGGRGLSDARLLAPKEIRHLFQAPLCYDETLSIDNPNSIFAPVWDELKAWMLQENLKLQVGEDMGNRDRSGVPWAEKDWGGYLYISLPKPEPVKPTPPAPQRVMQGATLTIKEAVWMMSGSCAITFLLTYFSMRH